MSVRIGIINLDGEVESIRCYQDDVAETLHRDYQDELRVRRLLRLGDITSLVEGQDIAVAYAGSLARKHPTLVQFAAAMRELAGAAVYLYDTRERTWLAAPVSRWSAAGSRTPEGVAAYIQGHLKPLAEQLQPGQLLPQDD